MKHPRGVLEAEMPMAITVGQSETHDLHDADFVDVTLAKEARGSGQDAFIYPYGQHQGFP